MAAAENPGLAVLITRHSHRSARPDDAACDDGQDADTAPEPHPLEPEQRSAAALRSVDKDEVGVVQQPVDGGGCEGFRHDRVESNRGWHMFGLSNLGWYLGCLLPGVSADL